MTQPMSVKPVSAVIGERLKELRNRRGISAAKLAARCAELGYPKLNRDVIANIEITKPQPRRHDVGVTELLVLAQALDASPLLLLFPEAGTDLAVTPDMAMDARRLVLLFAGVLPAAGLPTVGFEKDAMPIKWHRAVYDAEQRAKRADQTSRWARRNGDEEAAERHLEESRKHVKEMADVLNSMIDAGLETPPMNPGWAKLMITRGWIKDPEAIRTVDLSDLEEV